MGWRKTYLGCDVIWHFRAPASLSSCGVVGAAADCHVLIRLSPRSDSSVPDVSLLVGLHLSRAVTAPRPPKHWTATLTVWRQVNPRLEKNLRITDNLRMSIQVNAGQSRGLCPPPGLAAIRSGSMGCGALAGRRSAGAL